MTWCRLGRPGHRAHPASAVGLAGVDEAPESRVAPGLANGGGRGGGGGGPLTPELAGQALLVGVAEAVLDGQPGEVGFHVHVGLLTWDGVDWCDESILCARRGIFCSPANTPGDRCRTVAGRPATRALEAVPAARTSPGHCQTDSREYCRAHLRGHGPFGE